MSRIRPSCVVLLGAPGVGKGTYASMLSRWLGYEHISTGDAIRQKIRDKEPQFELYKQYVDNGELLPDSVVIPLLSSMICNKKAVLLDGFPRQLSQVAEVDRLTDVKSVLLLKLRREILIEKVIKRRICPQCSRSYNLADIKYGTMRMPPLSPNVPGVCDDCGSALVQRQDDTVEVVNKRLREFDRISQPVIDFFEERGLLTSFEIMGGKEDTWPALQDLFRKAGFTPEVPGQHFKL
uniref:Adenylate kinase active site lid domain-containing protein n=1 Tax=Spongospora subterranea TaxID=70186 RepID=A0A0H5R4G8_9EUKA|eukprot:CRZ09033.1 hypothetical protein [Spongospora subterranea]